jgi:type IV pilus assembly protein PilA
VIGGRIGRNRKTAHVRAENVNADDALEVEGEEAAEAGFTLIELMVVLLIMAILLAIAIPTFLGVTNTAGDRAAQSNLTNALTEAKALYQVSDAYSTNGAAYTAGQFQSQAPEFNWTTGACPGSLGGNCVSENVFGVTSSTDGQGVALAVYSSKTNTCWYAFDLEATPASSGVFHSGSSFSAAGVWYGKSTPTNGSCTAPNPDSVAVGAYGPTTGQSYSTAAAE